MNTHDVKIRGLIVRVVLYTRTGHQIYPVVGDWVTGISTDVNGKSVRISGKVEEVL